MEIKRTCPLGHTCEKVVDDHIERCMWYNKIVGIDGQGKDIEMWDCAIAQSPFLQTEVIMATRAHTAAVESLRNETIKRQDKALGLIPHVRNIEG